MVQMLTVSQALDQYYFEHIALKCVARRRAEDIITALKGFFEETPLHAVDIPLCRRYIAHRRRAPATTRRELGFLRTAATHAMRWRRISLGDMPSIELPQAPSSETVWYYKDELARLLDVAEAQDEKVFRFCQIAYHTASRRAAIETLTWEQVDTEARRINLAKPGEQKTKKRRPIVPISEVMAKELATMRSSAANAWVLGDPTPVFIRFCTVAAKAGVLDLPARGMRPAGRATPHSLRHARATHLLQEGKAPWSVANLLGDTVSTLLRTYAHACPDYLEEVLK